MSGPMTREYAESLGWTDAKLLRAFRDVLNEEPPEIDSDIVRRNVFDRIFAEGLAMPKNERKTGPKAGSFAVDAPETHFAPPPKD